MIKVLSVLLAAVLTGGVVKEWREVSAVLKKDQGKVKPRDCECGCFACDNGEHRQCPFECDRTPGDDAEGRGPVSENYPGGWFGESWGAPVCEEERHRDTPVGQTCVDCYDPIGPNDQGMLIPHLSTSAPATLEASHLECFLRHVRGPDLPGDVR